MDTQNNNFKVAETFDDLMTPEPEIIRLNQLTIQPQKILKSQNINKEINKNINKEIEINKEINKQIKPKIERFKRIKPKVEQKEIKSLNNDNLFEISKKTIMGTILFFTLSHDKIVETISKINGNKTVVLAVRLMIFFVLSFVINKYF
jgi:hypothetical protein